MMPGGEPSLHQIDRLGCPEDTVRTAAMLVALALISAAAVPATAQSNPAEESELEDAREDLEVAERQLADVEAELAAAQEAVGEADERLARAGAELADLEKQLAEAEAAAAASGASERSATAEYASATEELQGALADLREGRRRLHDAAATAYKHGRVSQLELLFGGLTSSRTPHEFAVTVRTVRTMIERDRRLVDETRSLLDAEARAHELVTSTRTSARLEHQRRMAVERTITALRDRQARLLDRIATERAARQRVLDGLEQDRTARAVLVRQLRERVASLSLAGVLVDPRTLLIEGPPPAWAPALPPAGRDWAPAVNWAAAKVGLDGRLLAAVVWTESGFHPGAVSHAGAIGLAQLMPGTAAILGVDPWDPLQNLSGGARYLRAMIDRFGAVDLGLAAYNAGPARVERAGGIPDIVETQLYVLRVVERYEGLVAATPAAAEEGSDDPTA